MTLSEVAQSGRKFRRQSDPKLWYEIRDSKIIQIGATPQTSVPVLMDGNEILATDWEYEPKSMLITASDLLETAKVLGQNPITHQRKFSVTEMAKLFIEELGL